MTSKPKASIRQFSSDDQSSTGKYLTIRLSALLCIISLGFALLSDYFLYQSLISKDISLLDSRLSTWQRVYKYGDLDKLLMVIQQENIPADHWLIHIQRAGQTVFLNQASTSANDQQLEKLYWPVVDMARKRWLIKTEYLSSTQHPDTEITVGISSLPRQEQLKTYRLAILFALIPILLCCLWLIRRTHRQALSPVLDLIRTTETIRRSKDLSARVPVRDATSELGHLAIQTNEFLEHTQHLIHSMQATLDNVAHDLRTPLARQRLRAEQLLLNDDIRQQKELSTLLADMTEENQRIEQMLTTLMDISQANSGLIELNASQYSVVELLSTAIDIFEFVLEEKSITVDQECPSELVIECDRHRILQVLTNLLDNAIKFSPADTRINITARSAGSGQIEITISDSGPGINEADLPFIFDRLYRGDKSRQTRGIGLGLSLVQAIVQAHHGTIRACNQSEQGACFSLFLPRKYNSQDN